MKCGICEKDTAEQLPSFCENCNAKAHKTCVVEHRRKEFFEGFPLPRCFYCFNYIDFIFPDIEEQKEPGINFYAHTTE